jgi:hypothetical protein
MLSERNAGLYDVEPGATKDYHCQLKVFTCSYKYGPAIAQLVEALRYKPEGREFHSRWCHWKFFIDVILPVALWPTGVDSACNRNECQEYFLGVKVAGA